MVAIKQKVKFYTYLTRMRDVKEIGLDVLAKVFLILVLKQKAML